MEIVTDAVVVGAGAAGLAAARALSRAGVHTVVLEARERVGGRLLTCEDPGLPVPVELGGEFVHGTAETSFALLREARSVALDTAGTSFVFDDGDLREGFDPFAAVTKVMGQATGLRDDLSIEAFTRDLPTDERRWLRMMVEGFDAADPARASTRALAEEWNGGPGGQTTRTFRPLGGYARLLRTLHAALDPKRARVLLETPIHAVRRHDGAVEIDAVTGHGTPLTVRARAAVITLPIAVLQSGSPSFEPALPPATRAALAHLIMGHVVKLVLRFGHAFWEELRDGRYLDAGFFHRAEAHFPTFWTLLPMRTPVLIAWAGGPKAEAMARLSRAARVGAALDDLSTLFGGESAPQAAFEAAYTHDWQADPYARGAYSYAAVGGYGARAALAAPVDGVLFFAGEATAVTAEAGTVAGALQSGERVAQDVLSSLGGAAARRSRAPVGE